MNQLALIIQLSIEDQRCGEDGAGDEPIEPARLCYLKLIWAGAPNGAAHTCPHPSNTDRDQSVRAAMHQFREGHKDCVVVPVSCDFSRLSAGRSGRSNAQITAPAANAIAAIIRKNSGFPIDDQKLPRYPARKLPTKFVPSHAPIIMATCRTGATFDTNDSPIGEMFERAIAEDQHQKREQQKRFEGHHEMAKSHQGGAEDDGAPMAEDAVGEKAAEYWREINEPGIEAIDLRREGLDVERAEKSFESVPQAGEADHLFGNAGLQHIFHHVKNEQRPHPVIGEAFPHLGREQEAEAARMPKKIIWTRRFTRHWGGIRNGHRLGGVGHPSLHMCHDAEAAANANRRNLTSGTRSGCLTRRRMTFGTPCHASKASP
jgi:hypothetical protein